MNLLPVPVADWLFRWRQSDGTSPLVLGQRRVFILPTRAGLLFAATLATMLLGAINYSLALGHALVFLLAGLGVALYVVFSLIERRVAGWAMRKNEFAMG